MEEPEKGSPASEDRSQKTAAALRALRDGLGTKLETHRRRISDLESDLTARVLQIAEEMAQDQATETQAELQLHDDQVRKLRDSLAEREATIAKLQRQLSDAELNQLRLSAELADSRSSIEAVRHKECHDCASLRSQFATVNENAAAADATIVRLEARIEELQGVLESTHRALESLRDTESAECEELRNALTEQQKQIEAAGGLAVQLETRVETLTQELVQARDAELKLHAQHTADNAAYIKSQLAAAQAQKLLSERTAELAAAAERESQTAGQAEDLLKQIETLTAELTESRDTEAKLLAQTTASDAAIAESKTATAETQQLLEERAAELAAASERESQANARVEQLLEQVETLTQDLAEVRKAQTELQSQHSADDAALAEATRSSEATQHALQEELTRISAERESLNQELAQVRAELAVKTETAADEASWLQKERDAAEQSRNQLAAEFEELLKQQKAAQDALAETQLKNDQSVALLQKAEERIAELTNSTQEELEQARRKFELALADAQKLKRESAHLQEELARRPEAAETESPELVSLRVERDALAARVAELESAPVQAVDEDNEQRLSDLQRRFELAVEDLRQFKQENARLQEKLAHAPQAGNLSPPSGQAMDWQSQKARLLAALESEDAEDQTTERRKELVTIEGTISITDRVVAEKDREIAELRGQLADRPLEVVEKSAESEVIDRDELIAGERVKLAALQKEWHDKLRSAELEMSLQRAALARREAEIEQKLQEVQHAQVDPAVGADGKPRRRWLSALGLRDDEEKDGKK
jgi:chromosome segregation ATPase